jgi:hypothetical protein
MTPYRNKVDRNPLAGVAIDHVMRKLSRGGVLNKLDGPRRIWETSGLVSLDNLLRGQHLCRGLTLQL